MDDPAQIGRRKRRSNRAVLAGIGLIAVGLLASAADLAPALATTATAVLGFVLLMYGVHVGWLVFYDRESDGPPS